MATEARRLVLVAAGLLALLAAPLHAQQEEPPGRPEQGRGAPLFLINGNTRLASVGFRFGNGGSVPTSRLEPRLALADPGTWWRIRRALDWLPLVSAPERMVFRPVELQRDKVRLLRFFRREGFPRVAVDYEVVLDTVQNAVDVTFVMDEGPPLIMAEVDVVGTDGAEPAVPPEHAAFWERFLEELERERGVRLSQVLAARMRSRTLEWWRDHGYAFAAVGSEVDSTRADPLQATLTLMVEPGPRAAIGQITIQGNDRLSDRTVRRELPFKSGDPFRSSRLAEGETELFGLDLVRLALVRVPDTLPPSESADVLVRLEEGSLRTIEGQLGYTSDDGISLESSWSHRDFLGGAKKLTLTGNASTGWWSGEEGPSSRYGLTGTLNHPYLGHRRVSGLASPYVEYRDDRRDRSTRVGLELTALWSRGPLRTMSITYGWSQRWVLQTRGGGLADVSDFLELLQTLDTVDTDAKTAVVTYTASWGSLDDLIAPRSGWNARIRADAAGPAALSDVQYFRLSGDLEGFLPLSSRVGLLARLSGGHLEPFGRSVRDSATEDPVQRLLRLRDAAFTAGGTGDVRGWSAESLGPKIPDIPVTSSGDSILLGRATRYVPLGGFKRWTGSLELQLPMPFVGSAHSIHAFLDGGRIWTADSRFVSPGTRTLLTLDDGTFFGTGAGVQFGTPVGPLRISVGYKLNPSIFDLRDPGAVAEALIAGTPVDELPADPGRRWQLHLSVGRSF